MKLSLFLLLIPLFSFSQKTDTLRIKNLREVSLDRYGNLYYSTANDDLYKINNQGIKEFVYSPMKRTQITHFEAWNSVKIFLFNREYQEYTLVNRFLVPLSTKAFNQDYHGFISYATIALDGNIWAIDNSAFALKKIDIETNKTLFLTNLNFYLNKESEVLFMKEHNNFLYVSTKSNGILVFDNMGTYKKKLNYNNVSNLFFNNDEIYFEAENEFVFFNLISLEERKLPIEKSLTFYLILSDKNLHIIKE